MSLPQPVPLVVLLRVQSFGGGWSVVLGAADAPAASAWIEPALVQDILQETAHSLAPSPLVVPGRRVLLRVQAEEQVGRMLARVLEAPPIATELAFWRGQAMGQGRPLLFLVDAHGDPGVAGLPWELLAWAPSAAPVSATDGCGVVRMARGQPMTVVSEAATLRPLVWCPDDADGVCADRLRALNEHFAALGLRAERLPDDLSTLPTPRSGVADVLHIVCHGALIEGEGALCLRGSNQAAGSAVQLLGPTLRFPALVMLDVCVGGVPTREQLRTLAGRLLEAGARACVAPAGPLALEASEAFCRGLYARLCEGGTIPEAVFEGRRQVEALQHPHPDHRPANLLLYVPTGAVASAPPPLLPGWQPKSWPPLARSTRVLFLHALERARRLGHGWLGVEHLLPELLSTLTRVAFRVRGALPVGPADWATLGGPVYPPAVERREPFLPPRMVALGERVPEGCEPDQLLELILQDQSSGVHALSSIDLLGMLAQDSERQTLVRRRSLVPATWLEVLWGPADGQRIEPRPGQTIGRPSQGRPSDHPVDAGHDQYASGVHRQHLTWLGPGRVETRYPLDVLPGGMAWKATAQRHETTLEVMVGDVLLVSAGVWLRGGGGG